MINVVNKIEKNEIDEIIQNILKEITDKASHRFGLIKYRKVFYGIPDSVFNSFRDIEYCYTFGLFEACISLIGTCLEKALKSELVRLYKINDKYFERLTLGGVITKAEENRLISNGILEKARGVNKIRIKYIHVDINKIKETFGYNTYHQISDWIQEAKTKSEAEPDCLEAYNNLMEILQHLYAKERYPL